MGIAHGIDKMTEKKFWQSLKRLLPDVHWQRIETTTASGVPDVNGCYKAGEFWLELKVLKGKPDGINQVMTPGAGGVFAMLSHSLTHGTICQMT